MKDEKKAPKLRFKGFTDDWEQCKLSSMTQYKNGKGHEDKQTDSGDFELVNLNSISIDGGFKHSGKFVNESDGEILYKNDLVMILSDVGHGDLLGRVALIPDDNKFILNQRVALLRPNKTANPEFLFFYINSHQKYFKSQGAGMSQLNISKKSVETFSSLVPNIDEQKKISLFLMKLDSLITLHEEKKRQLERLKSALLQKMFADENGNPAVRFKGFSEAWVSRKLFDVIVKIIDFRGRTPKKMGLNWSERGHLALSALNVKDGYIDFSTDAHYANEILYKKWMSGNELLKGQVLFTTEAPMGNVAQVPDNGGYVLSQRTISFVSNNSKITDNFLAVVLRSSKVQRALSTLASGGTAKGVSQSTLSQLIMVIPISLDEQQKIERIIGIVEELTRLYQNKLEILTELKKSLLQNMFI